jgi:hypothetical protein
MLAAAAIAAPGAAAHVGSFSEASGLDASSPTLAAGADLLLSSRLGEISTGGEPVHSPNVEYLGSIPTEGASDTGGRLVGRYFYVTSWRGFSIYDVSDPIHPELMSQTPFEEGFRFENEDVSVSPDGRLLLFSDFATNQKLYVYDVSDKRNPREIAQLPGSGTHTAQCILGCEWEYGSYFLTGPKGAMTGGHIVDLRDPAHPHAAGDWGAEIAGFTGKVHDVNEVRPGLVLTASMPMLFLDARQDPLRPTLLARGTNVDKRLHTAIWPNGGRDRFILSSFETNATPRCEADSGEFSTWDASRWRETGTFTKIDDFRASNGTFTDGSPPANVLGCSAHWFEPRPDFKNGGIVAAGFYDHGTKFLRVDRGGQIEEAGFILPPGAETSAAYWITDEIVYTVDYARGMDIVRFKGTP